ncbi:hypothetical protein BOTBODRAFT_571532 [Botryobasidium botryosum FD-172 SS1]|uniref:Threonine/Serine exporter ThrE domain-containing protein n=1 Tax=Botryobasidium botryosum (strain FD-172 SS1) TaxID=930990 RepID=A0A067LY19_BOTB1|nr:hypothetical protein BOTBODRAFT_571532 [Botryobasidium botryosum FD-172 SS1]
MGNAIGNSVGFLIFPAARRMREEAAKSMDHTLYSHGSFVSDNSTTIPSFSGSFAFSNHTELGVINQYHYRADGCYRDPSYSWTMRALPWWTQFFMVPLFCLVLSSLNGQPVNSLKAGWTMAVMVFIGCASYTVNTLINQYVFKQTEVVSMVGAFVVGILGIGYARWTKGTAFVVMVTAVLFMVPSGIAEAAELEDLQDFVIGNVGVRTVIVAIAITVGLNASTCVMYFFGRRKMGGVFAF